MPEYPEISHLAGQMNGALTGKTISGAEVNQEKCLNMSVEAFQQAVSGRTIIGVTSLGKWAFMALDDGARLALNLNMGGNVVLRQPGEPLRDKWRAALRFADGSALSVGFWFLGSLHHIAPGQAHALTDNLGADPMAEGFSFEDFDRILGQRKATIKSVLLRQDLICGIGNFYVQDLLFLARLHPARPVNSLDQRERRAIYDAMRSLLADARRKGGAWYENGLDDQPGGFEEAELLVGYRQGQPCPACGEPIVKIKTGSTSGFICPQCQKERP